MTERLETIVRQTQGQPLPRHVVLVDLAYPGEADYAALDGCGVMYVTVVTRDRSELPVRRVTIAANGQETVLQQLESVLVDQSGASSLVVASLGPFREDGLYLLPVRLRLSPADVVVELAGTSGRMKAMTFSATIPPALAGVAALPMKGTGPSEQRLDRFIRSELPGWLGEEPKGRSRPASEDELAEIARRGHQLAAYDRAAWLATEAVGTTPLRSSGVTHYIAREQAGRWTVAFGRLNATRDRFVVVYDAAPEGASSTYVATKPEPPREERGFLPTAARAIDAVRAATVAADRLYNLAVLPASGGRLWVYLLPAQTESDVFPLGGDVRCLVAADGLRILERRQMHRARIEYRGAGRSTTEPSLHTVLDDAPEDSDVFHVLARRPSVPAWVVSRRFAYLIQTTGAIQYVTTAEELRKMLAPRRESAGPAPSAPAIPTSSPAATAPTCPVP